MVAGRSTANAQSLNARARPDGKPASALSLDLVSKIVTRLNCEIEIS